MFKIGIIDDEMIARKKINDIINRTIINLKIDYKVFEYSSANAFLSSNNTDIDLLFLDIEMGSENGVELSKIMFKKAMKPIIVFVSSYDGYINDAFGLNIYAYVLKSEIEKRLPIIINNVIKQLEKKAFVILATENGNETFMYDDIVYVTIDNRKFFIKTLSNLETTRINATTLSGIKLLIGDQFLQVNAKYIVNGMHIKLIENGAVILANDECIFISRGKFKQFNNLYKDYLIRGGI